MQQDVQADSPIAKDSLGVVAQTEVRFPSGPVPLDSPLYINRPPVEERAYTEVSQPGCLICIKAPRKRGKSSLVLRILARAAALGYRTVYLDFQEADANVFVSLDKFLRWFSANVSRQLHLNPTLDDYWDEDIGSKMSCKIYLEGYLLEQINSPVVLALDEVNRVFEYPYVAQEFLPMLRSWHEQGRTVKIWQKLRLVVAHSTELYIPLDINQSPFNVGLSIKLPPLNLEQVQDLVERYGLAWRDDRQTQKLMAIVGGHPYLASLALYHLRLGEMTLEELLLASPTPSGIYSDYLRGYLAMLREEPELASALQQVVTADESILLEAIAQSALPPAIAAYKLESMGLIQLDGNQAQPSCELYRLYFREQLARQDWIEAQPELWKQEKQELPRKDNVALSQWVSWNSFNQYLETMWQQWVRESLLLSLIMCDIDYFNFFQDAYGQQVGDACIQLIAEVIQDYVKDKATLVAHYGGTLFSAVFPQMPAEAAVEIAEMIREGVQAQAIAHDQSQVGGFPASVVTVSLGVASVAPDFGTSPALLIAAAEKALEQSKRRGRNCVTLAQ